MPSPRTQVPLTVDFSQNPVPGADAPPGPRPLDSALITGRNAATRPRPAPRVAPPVRHGVQNPLPVPPEDGS